VKLAQRVLARYIERVAKAKSRQDAVRDTHPINKPHGIAKDIVDEHGRSVEFRFENSDGAGDELGYGPRDIRPEDVFAGTPDQMGVRNFAETGKDLQKALDHQVPKDKGYDSVSNLSQFLIRTEGGGGTKPVGQKKK
jgi:hypothetical protein